MSSVLRQPKVPSNQNWVLIVLLKHKIVSHSSLAKTSGSKIVLLCATLCFCLESIFSWIIFRNVKKKTILSWYGYIEIKNYAWLTTLPRFIILFSRDPKEEPVNRFHSSFRVQLYCKGRIADMKRNMHENCTLRNIILFMIWKYSDVLLIWPEIKMVIFIIVEEYVVRNWILIYICICI